MSDIVLTKSADKTLCNIYKVYLERLNRSQSKSSATYFDICNFKTNFPDINEDDMLDDLIELENNNLVEKFIDGSFILNSNGIIYMENRFKNGLTELVDFISKLIP